MSSWLCWWILPRRLCRNLEGVKSPHRMEHRWKNKEKFLIKSDLKSASVVKERMLKLAAAEMTASL